MSFNQRSEMSVCVGNSSRAKASMCERSYFLGSSSAGVVVGFDCSSDCYNSTVSKLRLRLSSWAISWIAPWLSFCERLGELTTLVEFPGVVWGINEVGVAGFIIWITTTYTLTKWNWWLKRNSMLHISLKWHPQYGRRMDSLRTKVKNCIVL